MTHRGGVLMASGNRLASTGMQLWSVLYGATPGATMLTITEPVLLDIDALVHGLEVEGDGQLIFDPNSSRLLRVDQQRPVCVMDGGHLEMNPASPTITHELRFVNVNEELFTAGGGMNHTGNPGLCVEDATVTLRGATKTGWTRTTGALSAGATTCTVVDASGWRIGDEIIITPTELVSVANNIEHFDRRTLTNVAGNVLTFAALTHPHPSNTTPSGVTIFPEVANLTRNVLISGEVGKRAQIMFMEDCTGSILEYFEGKYLGPRRTDLAQSPETLLITGRYMLHFHLMGEGARDIEVTGVAMHDGGSRGFVPHHSHGMTFTDCVAWDVMADGYWWDASALTDETSDLLYDHCFAGRVKFLDANPGGSRNSGFALAGGVNMTIRDCCAAGIPGTDDTAGYHWPELGYVTHDNLWFFEDNDSHNNADHGIFVWQNDQNHHEVTRARCWNNDVAGVEHGAYISVYHWNDLEVWGNGRVFDIDFMMLTVSHDAELPRLQQVIGGHIPHFQIGEHNVPGARARMHNVVMTDVVVNETGTFAPGLYDFVDCNVDNTDFNVVFMDPASNIRVQLGASAWQITAAGTTSISTFYP